MRTHRLVEMANQIAMSIPDRGHAAELTAAHLRSFWTPAMIAELDAHARENGPDVSAEVHDALSILSLRA